MDIHIDVVGTCNLRCPSCPQGNVAAGASRKGLLEASLLDRILSKATDEFTVRSVLLYNWTEPLLHPRLADLVRVVRGHGLPCHLSSNLNSIARLDEVLKAQPDSLRISLSGFDQERYSRTHRGGDVERVKENMVELSGALERTGSPTHVEVCFHRYRDNAEDERRMSRLAARLGFGFSTLWAVLCPIEKAIELKDGPPPPETELAELLELIAYPIREGMDFVRRTPRYRTRECSLWEDQLVLNHLGDVQLCCAVYDSTRFGLGAYLDRPLERIQADRRGHSACRECMGAGLHVMYTQRVPELERIAAERSGRPLSEA